MLQGYTRKPWWFVPLSQRGLPRQEQARGLLRRVSFEGREEIKNHLACIDTESLDDPEGEKRIKFLLGTVIRIRLQYGLLDLEGFVDEDGRKIKFLAPLVKGGLCPDQNLDELDDDIAAEFSEAIELGYKVSEEDQKKSESVHGSEPSN